MTNLIFIMDQCFIIRLNLEQPDPDFHIPERNIYIKNDTHVKKVGHTSEFLFGIY